MSVLSKTIENKHFNPNWHNSYSKACTQIILYLKTKLIFKSKLYLPGLIIKQNTKHLSASNIFWHLWCSNNLKHSYHCSNLNPVLGPSNYSMQSPALLQNIFKFCTFLHKFLNILPFSNISLPLFSKISPMPLLSRIGPGNKKYEVICPFYRTFLHLID